jgi:UDP-glucuronate 4-epimerase
LSKTIFVSGAAGFIGSHVSQAFLDRGDRVIALDDLNDYYAPARKQANLQELQHSSPTSRAFVFVPGDIRDRQLLRRLFAEHCFDAVIHLAAMPGVRVSMDNPHLYCDVNLIGTLNLLEAARLGRVGNFVFASTSSVYGNTRQIPFVETDTCDRPLAPYPATKRAAELLCFTYHHLYALNCTVLRFFTVYGPRSRPDMMAAKVVDNICFGRPVPLYNEGQMHRDWTYVGDIVQGVVAAADRPLGYEVINLGRGEPILLADFVRLIEELAGRKAKLLPAPMPETDMPYTYADIKKAQRLLGYHPTISVHEGVARYWHWYRALAAGPALAA